MRETVLTAVLFLATNSAGMTQTTTQTTAQVVSQTASQNASPTASQSTAQNAPQSTAQNTAQNAAPKATYDFSLAREEKIKLAESAAPAEISGKATVYVLERGGYVKVRDGVERIFVLRGPAKPVERGADML